MQRDTAVSWLCFCHLTPEVSSSLLRVVRLSSQSALILHSVPDLEHAWPRSTKGFMFCVEHGAGLQPTHGHALCGDFLDYVRCIRTRQFASWALLMMIRTHQPGFAVCSSFSSQLCAAFSSASLHKDVNRSTDSCAVPTSMPNRINCGRAGRAFNCVISSGNGMRCR